MHSVSQRVPAWSTPTPRKTTEFISEVFSLPPLCLSVTFAHWSEVNSLNFCFLPRVQHLNFTGPTVPVKAFPAVGSGRARDTPRSIWKLELGEYYLPPRPPNLPLLMCPLMFFLRLPFPWRRAASHSEVPCSAAAISPGRHGAFVHYVSACSSHYLIGFRWYRKSSMSLCGFRWPFVKIISVHIPGSNWTQFCGESSFLTKMFI